MQSIKTLLRNPKAVVREGQTLREALHVMVKEDVSTLAVLGHQRADDMVVVGVLNHQSLRSQNLDQPLNKKHLSLRQIVYVDPAGTLLPDEAQLGRSKQPVPVACERSGQFLGLLYRSDFASASNYHHSSRSSTHKPLYSYAGRKGEGEEDLTLAPIHDG